jgi:hypothetical protein
MVLIVARPFVEGRGVPAAKHVAGWRLEMLCHSLSPTCVSYQPPRQTPGRKLDWCPFPPPRGTVDSYLSTPRVTLGIKVEDAEEVISVDETREQFTGVLKYSNLAQRVNDTNIGKGKDIEKHSLKDFDALKVKEDGEMSPP